MCVLMYTGLGLRGMEVGREPVCTDVLCPFYGGRNGGSRCILNYPTVGINLLQGKGGSLYVLTYTGPRLKEGECLCGCSKQNRVALLCSFHHLFMKCT